MSAIATTNFHNHMGRQFIESLSESANDVYYMFIARPTPWANGDSTPTPPEDSMANTGFCYWNDMLGAQRIYSDQVSYVVPRNDWVANTKYSMYDHRIPMSTLRSNVASFYVRTITGAVFKCIYNGASNSTSGASNSTSEPTIAGQTDVAALTFSNGNPNGYVWKYLFNVSEGSLPNFETNSWLPVPSIFDTLNANGDVNDDSSATFDVFESARTTGNGAILRVLVETPGVGYLNPPSITITGDGISATATANVSSGQVTQINVSSPGLNYSRAKVTISANGDSGSGATATPIISPRTWFSNSSGVFYKTSHGINFPEELGAKSVMLYAELSGVGANNELAVGNDYRRIGIVKNPLLYGTNTIATGNTYSLTTDLTIGNIAGGFNNDEIVWQQSTNAYGVIVERSGSTLKLVNINGEFSNTGTTVILGIGNGNAAGMIANASVTITPTPEAFTPTVSASGATADVTSISYPDINPYSGTILYVDHRAPVTRSTLQSELLQTILTF